MVASNPLDSSYAVMAMIRATLLADTYLQGILAGSKIVDKASSSMPTPFITFSTMRSNDWSTASEDAQEHLIDLGVWHEPDAQTPDTGTARAIMAQVRSLLHTAAPAIASPFNLVLMRVTNQLGPFRDPDGKTLHGVVSVRVVVDHS